MSIVLTEKAAVEVKRIIEDQKLEDDVVLRWESLEAVVAGFLTHLVSTRHLTKKSTPAWISTACLLSLIRKVPCTWMAPLSISTTESKNGASRSITPMP